MGMEKGMRMEKGTGMEKAQGSRRSAGPHTLLQGGEGTPNPTFWDPQGGLHPFLKETKPRLERLL